MQLAGSAASLTTSRPSSQSDEVGLVLASPAAGQRRRGSDSEAAWEEPDVAQPALRQPAQWPSEPQPAQQSNGGSRPGTNRGSSRTGQSRPGYFLFILFSFSFLFLLSSQTTLSSFFVSSLERPARLSGTVRAAPGLAMANRSAGP